MPETTTAAPEKLAAADAEHAVRSARKLTLLREIAILKIRKAALDLLIAERQKALELAMTREGDRALTDPYGTAKFGSRRSVTVHDPKAAMRLFSKEMLAEYFKPDVAFVEAAARAKKDISSAVTIGVSDEFKVERSRTKEAKKRAQEIIESTKQETEAVVVALAKRLLRDNPNDSQ
jgi:hypothetical protein